MNHKELYGMHGNWVLTIRWNASPISSLTLLGNLLIIIHDKQIAMDILDKNFVKPSTGPRPVVVFELYFPLFLYSCQTCSVDDWRRTSQRALQQSTYYGRRQNLSTLPQSDIKGHMVKTSSGQIQQNAGYRSKSFLMARITESQGLCYPPVNISHWSSRLMK